MLKELFFVLSDIQYAAGIDTLQKNLLENKIITYAYVGQMQIRTFHKNCQDKMIAKESIVVTDHIEVYENLRVLGYKNMIVLIQEHNRESHFVNARYAVESLENLDYDYFLKVYLRFCGLPWEIGRTKRCILREMTVLDVDALYQLYEDPEITTYMEGLYEDKEEEIVYIKDYIEKVYSFYGIGTWLIVQKGTGTIIGRAGFNWRAGYEEPELGFMIAKPYQKQGYAKEVCNEILQIGIREYGFETVQALVRVGNTVSAHLCETLQFSLQGEVVEDGIVHHRYIWTHARKENETTERQIGIELY